MSVAQAVLLGFVAGLPWLGGPMLARLHPLGARARVGLNAVGIAILVGLLWAVLTQAYLPLDGALVEFRDGADGLAPALRLAGLFVGGLVVGFGVLAVYELSLRPRASALPVVNPPGDTGAMVITETAERTVLAPRLGFVLAVGIGLPNVAVGLGLGTSAAEGQVALTLLLVIGVVVHNGIEGLSIAVPFTSTGERAAAGRLLFMGVIAGAPMVLGIMLGQLFSNDEVNVALLALAGGVMFYITIAMVGLIGHRPHPGLFHGALIIALIAVFATNMLITVGGAGA